MAQPRSGFLPTRDLPRLRPTPSRKAIQTALDSLAAAVRLGQEDVKRFDLAKVFPSQDTALPDAGSVIVDDSAAEVASASAEEGDADSHARLGSVEYDIEARFSQTWLTKVVSCDEDPDLQDGAARILAALCGKPASQPTVTRFTFAEGEGASAEVIIQDSPITADALGNRTWGAAPLLARTLLADYLRILNASPLSLPDACNPAVSASALQRFEATDPAPAPRSVLELGAGTGLVGLALCAAAKAWDNATRPGKGIRRVSTLELDTTDYHPHVLANLEANLRLNRFSPECDGVDTATRIGVAKLDWQAVHQEVSKCSRAAPDDAGVTEPREASRNDANDSAYISTAQTLPDEAPDGHAQNGSWPTVDSTKQYDVIIAADCIYDPFHPLWIRSVATRHLTRRFADSKGADGTSMHAATDVTGRHGEDAHVPMPSADEQKHLLHPGVLFLISPLRRTHAAEIRAIYEAFPRAGASTSTTALRPESQPELELQITREWEEIGWDDFGPRSFKFSDDSFNEGDSDQSGGDSRRGLRTTYRTFEIRWCPRRSAT